MRSRFFLPVSLLVLIVVIPAVAHATIPNFGPIIPAAEARCPAGWGLLITVINNLIELGITLAIVFVAPLSIAYAGFLYVVSPVDPGGKNKAKAILTNTIVGIVIALSGWIIVDAVMAVLYKPNDAWGAWTNIISSGGSSTCLDQAGAREGDGLNVTTRPGTTVSVPGSGGTCSVSDILPITDPIAQQIESGTRVIWTNTDPRLQTCVSKFIMLASGVNGQVISVTSAYRPQAYQAHLFEVKTAWCENSLQSNTESACASLKEKIRREIQSHFGSTWNCGTVASNGSNHTAGTAVDMSGVNVSKAEVLSALATACLQQKPYAGDPYHFELKVGCSCS